MSNYPVEIAAFQNAILALKGIKSIESGIDNLEVVDCTILASANYAHLPHAALLRTQGGLEGEVLCQFELYIDKNTDGLNVLEFLAWFVRDQARGGKKLQLRPFALPPETPFGRQLGATLRFHIDVFQDGVGETLEPVFKLLDSITTSLVMAIELYHIPLQE